MLGLDCKLNAFAKPNVKIDIERKCLKMGRKLEYILC